MGPLTSVDRPVRWGLWGCGRVAGQFAADLRRTPGVEVAAVASRTHATAQAFAARHRIPTVHGDLAALSRDPAVDVVYISTPHHCHAADSLRCLDAGKPVVCEKPFALSGAQAHSVFEMAGRRGVFCMEALWTRFVPVVAEAAALVRSGELGAVVGLSGDFAYPTAFEPADRLYAAEQGGGALLDRGVYLVSLAQMLLGEPSSVHCHVRRAATGVDEHASFQLNYPSGVSAQFMASLAVRGSNEFTLRLEHGSIVLHEPFFAAHRGSVRRSSRPAPKTTAPAVQGGLKGGVRLALEQHGLHRRFDLLRLLSAFRRSWSRPFEGHGFQFEIEEVNRCLRQGQTQSPVMPWADSLTVARTMDRLAAAATGT